MFLHSYLNGRDVQRKNVVKMWTSQGYGHHDKMARTKTHRTSQTRSIQRRNIHKEITIFCVFLIFLGVFYF